MRATASSLLPCDGPEGYVVRVKEDVITMDRISWSANAKSKLGSVHVEDGLPIFVANDGARIATTALRERGVDLVVRGRDQSPERPALLFSVQKALSAAEVPVGPPIRRFVRT
jgi:hypothetical protein